MAMPAGRFEQVGDRNGAVEALETAYRRAVASRDWRATGDYCERIRDIYLRVAMRDGASVGSCAKAYFWNGEAERAAAGKGGGEG